MDKHWGEMRFFQQITWEHGKISLLKDSSLTEGILISKITTNNATFRLFLHAQTCSIFHHEALCVKSASSKQKPVQETVHSEN